MTTEDHLQNMLDDRLDDWQTLLVLSDFLAETGDRRSLGYQALGRNDFYCESTWFNDGFYTDPYLNLPEDWFLLLQGGQFGGSSVGFKGKLWCDFNSKKQARDAAALAFSHLPPERQAELLKGNQ